MSLAQNWNNETTPSIFRFEILKELQWQYQ